MTEVYINLYVKYADTKFETMGNSEILRQSLWLWKDYFLQ